MPNVGGQPQMIHNEAQDHPHQLWETARSNSTSFCLAIDRKNHDILVIFIRFQANWEFVWKDRIWELDLLKELKLDLGIPVSFSEHIQADRISVWAGIKEIDHDGNTRGGVFRSGKTIEQ